MSSQSLQLGRGKMIRKPATTTTRPSKSTSQLPSQPALRATSNTAPTISQLPFEEPQVDQHPIAHNSENSSIPAELKKTRGKTTGKGMIEMIARNGNKKVEIIFDQEHWVPNTEYTNKKFTTAIGIEVRSRAPVCYCGWNKIPANIKRTLREGLTVHFDVKIEHPKIIYFVDDKIRSSYTQFNWKLHDHYQKCGTPARGRATLPPPEGKKIRGLGSFPHMELPTTTSSTTVSSEMNVMQDKVKRLESTLDTIRSKKAQLMTMLKQFMMNSQGCFADTENIDMNIVVPNSEEDDVFRRDEDGVQNNGDNSETEDFEEDL